MLEDSFTNTDFSLFDHLPKPKPSLRVCVIVPVCNEADHIGPVLDALRNQMDDKGTALPWDTYEVLLLANNCSDNSFLIARDYQLANPNFNLHLAETHLPAKMANIGFVRGQLMDEASARLLNHASFNGIIASTDGDTEVDARWIYYTMQEIDNGCDAVGGRILTRNDASPARRFYLQDITYRMLLAQAESLLYPQANDPRPRHFQYFGASMAVKRSVYQEVGRLPRVPFLEDNAFHDALIKMDFKVRKSPLVKVYTSTRLSGRVAIGFSEQLQKWTNDQQNGFQQKAEPATARLIKFKCKQALRQCFDAHLSDDFYDQRLIKYVAAELFLEEDFLNDQISHQLNFGQLWHNVRLKMQSEKWCKNWQLVPITEAIAELRVFISCFNER